MRVAEYCECGMSFVGLVRGYDPARIERVIARFWESHQGEGHGKVDAKTARNARRRARYREEAAYFKETGRRW